jgi:hypothetical protein
MGNAPAAHGRGYYATRATARAITYTAIVAGFFALPTAVEALAKGLGL